MRSATPASGAIVQKIAVPVAEQATLVTSTDQTPSHLAPFQAAQFQVVDRQGQRAATAGGAINQKTAVCAMDVAMLTPSTPTQTPV